MEVQNLSFLSQTPTNHIQQARGGSRPTVCNRQSTRICAWQHKLQHTFNNIAMKHRDNNAMGKSKKRKHEDSDAITLVGPHSHKESGHKKSKARLCSFYKTTWLHNYEFTKVLLLTNSLEGESQQDFQGSQGGQAAQTQGCRTPSPQSCSTSIPSSYSHSCCVLTDRWIIQ